MIHFFPELAALYHRSVVISLSEGSRRNFFDEWTQQLWRISPDQSSFRSLAIKKKSESRLSGWAAGSLGQRNADQQRFISMSLSLQGLVQKPQLADAGDSLFFEIDATSSESEELFAWQPDPAFAGKKIVWCLKRELSLTPTLHELALDKKLKELAPESMRILWGDTRFMRDALEWVLSF